MNPLTLAFITQFIPAATVLLASLFLSACKEEDPSNDANPPQTSQYVTISGTVVNQNGMPVTDAALHVVYELPATAPLTAEPAIPSQVIFNCTQVLTTQCGGNTPLPDGIPVRIFWDRDADGPDETDEPPPLCDEPPTCATGPMGTVNLNEFVINGAALADAPGTFFMEQAMTTALDMMNPSRFYLRIFCGNGGLFYTSQVLNVPGGPSEFDVTFTCTPCNDVPQVPVWSFQPGYPNPVVDSVSFRFGIQRSTQTTITLVAAVTQREFSLLSSSLYAGDHLYKLDLRNYANGYYDVRLRAGGFSEHHALLKNTTDVSHLRNTPGITLTNSQGQFTLQTVAGVAISRRDPQGQSQGTALLTRLRVIALKNGYQPADSVFDIASGGNHSLLLRLLPN